MSRSGVYARLPPALLRRTSVGGHSPLRFFAFSARSARRRSIRRAFGVGRSIVANVSRCHSTRVCVQSPAGHAFVNREDAIPVVFRSVARVGSV
jgi:hypothetical protein